jgi:ribonucleoside-triphosphate reductase (formate)
MTDRIFEIEDGMPLAIWQNKYSRWLPSQRRYQTWAERVEEVVEGNFSLLEKRNMGFALNYEDITRTLELSKAGVMAYSGRHLQHGDEDQKNKWGEYWTNCSTAAFSFIKFFLLLKGSGVGRCYDSDICLVNWDFMPNTRFVLDSTHADYESWIESTKDANHKYPQTTKDVRWFQVEDSAEGWVKVVEILETASYQEKHKDKLFIFNFSKVRKRGAAIRGQQGRPASGPVPFIKALMEIASIKGASLAPWKQALFIDHYLASCVVIGGVRRSSRIAIKHWKDDGVMEFIDIKRGNFLWSANNSIAVDEEFWEQAKTPGRSTKARIIFEAACKSAYYDKTGEPAFINVDKLSWIQPEPGEINENNFLGSVVSKGLDIHPKTTAMIASCLRIILEAKDYSIVNPCSEISLSVLGGYCVVGDICLANVETLDEAIDSARLMTHALIRTNLMDFLYQGEVDRTNRIGVSIMGVHEFAYQHFGCVWGDLVGELTKGSPGQRFWDFIDQLGREAEVAAVEYSNRIGVNVPHTVLCTKPGGTVPKVTNLASEGINLPPYDFYLRWVQYHEHDKQLPGLIKSGYPTKDISSQYREHIAVGFPTITRAGRLMGSDVVTPKDATIAEQFVWLQRLELYWLGGDNKNNQLSYTMKYDSDKVSYSEYEDLIFKYMSSIKCCAMMPQINKSAYVYVPEERVTEEEYWDHMERIKRKETESYSEESIMCEGGACGIDGDYLEKRISEETLPSVKTLSLISSS